jgi:hypothetical protein
MFPKTGALSDIFAWVPQDEDESPELERVGWEQRRAPDEFIFRR